MKPRTITIVPVLNGFIVNVGCQSVVVKTPAELGAEITKYYTNPGNTERLYKEGRVNDMLTPPVLEETPAPPTLEQAQRWGGSLVRSAAPPNPTSECDTPPQCDPRR